jgi:DNA invertase Pin-like site-specific DNA recombinase
MAAFAEHEANRISERTKAALAAKKTKVMAEGKPNPLGIMGPQNLKRNIEERQEQAQAFAEKLRPVLFGFKQAQMTQAQQVEQLNQLGISTPRGCQWSRMQLHRVMHRLT